MQDRAVSSATQTVVSFDESAGASDSSSACGSQTIPETVNANVMNQAAVSDRAFISSLQWKSWHRWIPLPSQMSTQISGKSGHSSQRVGVRKRKLVAEKMDRDGARRLPPFAVLRFQ
jgi:hypothetical protein